MAIDIAIIQPIKPKVPKTISLMPLTPKRRANIAKSTKMSNIYTLALLTLIIPREHGIITLIGVA